MICLVCGNVVGDDGLFICGEAICSCCIAHILNPTVEQIDYDRFVRAMRFLWENKLVPDPHSQGSG